MPLHGWQVTGPVVNSSSLPCVVEADDVVFGWQNVSTAQDSHQEAWRIEMVAEGFVFDSGWVYGPEDHFVRVPGLRLEPGRLFKWRVTTRSSFRRAGMSQAAFFSTLPDPWTAAWVRHPDWRANNTCLRTSVAVESDPVEAVWFVAGMGTCQATIDGRPVSPNILEPGRTRYDRTALVCGYDVTELLTAGIHTLQLELGRGFYDMTTPTTWRWHQAAWRNPCRATAELHLRMPDGTTRVIGTGPTWQAAEGKVRFDSMYEGESFEADHQLSWVPAEASDPRTPGPRLVPQTGDPVRVMETLAPRWQATVADFGKIIAGTGQFQLAQGVPEARFRARYRERLSPGGDHVAGGNPHVFTERFATDEVHLSPAHPTWAPSHSYQGFRYIEILDLDDPPGALDVTARRISSALAPNCKFWCSDDDLNRLHRAMTLSLSNSMIDVPIDSPSYDKNGWTGDAQVWVHAMLTSFNMARFLSAWLDDMADAQLEDGRLPVIVPSPSWGYGPPESAPAPEWTTAYPYLLAEHVNEYGDLRLLERHYDRASRYLDHELSRRDDLGLIDSVMGDYLPPGTHGPAPEDHRLTATLFVARALRSLASVSLMAGRWEHARLNRVADDLIRAVNAAFLDPSAGYYRSDRDDGYRQTHNVLPLAMGIVPAALRDTVIDSLLADIEARGGHHNCGHIGVRYLPGVLSEVGRSDLALAVLRNPTPPGWLPWLNEGNQTLAEGWDDVRAGSHPLMTGAMSWLHEHLAGLRNEGRAWTVFSVTPDLSTDLTTVRLRRGSVHGVIGVEWDKRVNRLEVSVPVGSKAAVNLTGRRYDVGPGHWQFPLHTTGGHPEQREAGA